jgi:hypothetical protein
VSQTKADLRVRIELLKLDLRKARGRLSVVDALRERFTAVIKDNEFLRKENADLTGQLARALGQRTAP